MWHKHFATICQKGTQPFRKKVELLEASDNNRETYLVVETIHISSVHETWEMTLKVRETDITFRLDTAAQANVLPLNTFNAVNKVDGESMDQWLIHLGSQAAICEFGAQEDLMIRDKLVYGVMDERAKERLLREGELTVQWAMDICHAAESTRRQLHGMKCPNAKPVAVNTIGKSHNTHRRDKGQSAKARPKTQERLQILW